MNKKLDHLSKEKISNLIERYYGGEKVKDLLEEFRINVRPPSTGKPFPSYRDKSNLQIL